MSGRGLEQAIAALPHAPGATLRLIGPGRAEYVEGLRQLARAAGVADRVEFAAPVDPEAVPAAICDADVGLMLIQPVCLSYELTLPNKLFEYAAAGVPIVASDLQVSGAIVRDERLGTVVPPDDPRRVAEAIARLSEPEVNAEARERVRAFAARETWEQERRSLERVYLGR
jgi:glycosyltransferase involved in cell wall biosynthesis